MRLARAEGSKEHQFHASPPYRSLNSAGESTFLVGASGNIPTPYRAPHKVPAYSIAMRRTVASAALTLSTLQFFGALDGRSTLEGPLMTQIRRDLVGRWSATL